VITVETSLKLRTDSRFLRRIFGALSEIAGFLRSEYAHFGFRVAVATLAGSIPAFLENSQVFYTEYRGVWITNTLVLGMSPTTGASLNGFFARCLGTVIGGLLAMGAWYIVDKKVSGVIVLTLVVCTIRTLSGRDLKD